MKLKFAFMVCLVVMLATLTMAQTPPPSALLTWVGPTTYTDGSAIGTAAISYKIYGGLSTLETQQGVSSTTTFTVPTELLPTNGTMCWVVSAVVNGTEGGKSNEVCKSFGSAPPSKVPNPATNLKVQ